MDLNGKVAFVTGGSGDIGKAIVGALAVFIGIWVDVLDNRGTTETDRIIHRL